MEIPNKDSTQIWRSIVAILMAAAGCACFIMSMVCSMIVAKKQK